MDDVHFALRRVVLGALPMNLPRNCDTYGDRANALRDCVAKSGGSTASASVNYVPRVPSHADTTRVVVSPTSDSARILQPPSPITVSITRKGGKNSTAISTASKRICDENARDTPYSPMGTPLSVMESSNVFSSLDRPAIDSTPLRSQLRREPQDEFDTLFSQDSPFFPQFSSSPRSTVSSASPALPPSPTSRHETPTFVNVPVLVPSRSHTTPPSPSSKWLSFSEFACRPRVPPPPPSMPIPIPTPSIPQHGTFASCNGVDEDPDLLFDPAAVPFIPVKPQSQFQPCVNCNVRVEVPVGEPPLSRIEYSREFLLSFKDKCHEVPRGLAQTLVSSFFGLPHGQDSPKVVMVRKPSNEAIPPSDGESPTPQNTPCSPAVTMTPNTRDHIPDHSGANPSSPFTPGFSKATHFSPGYSTGHPQGSLSGFAAPSPFISTASRPPVSLEKPSAPITSLGVQLTAPRTPSVHASLLPGQIPGPSDVWLLRKALLRCADVELSPARLEARQKQIDYGIVTIGYQNFMKLVGSKTRRGDPIVPNKFQLCSKRSWDGQVRKWRRTLHFFDDAKTWNDVIQARIGIQQAAIEKKERLLREAEESKTMNIFVYQRNGEEDSDTDSDGDFNADGDASPSDTVESWTSSSSTVPSGTPAITRATTQTPLLSPNRKPSSC
ncbi:histone RNA hairpin-binding protein [Pelomyxa schiedti]|nr:histone RNA hairpin-binding protein [Pelomyxa schiedti]